MINEIRRWLKDLRKDAKYRYRSMAVDEPSEGGSQETAITRFVTSSNPYVSWDATGTTAVGGEIPKYNPVKEDERIEKRPVEVVQEIVSEKPVICLMNLKKQIKAVEKRRNCLKKLDCGCGDEELALKYLRARKDFIKYQRKFPWVVTTEIKIKDLCSKYKLKTSSLSLNYKNLPMEAVDELEKFVKAYELVAADKPKFSLIVDDGGKETKKDPILLADSPFGKWHYILGAWDKEVEYVDDLVYKGK